MDLTGDGSSAPKVKAAHVQFNMLKRCHGCSYSSAEHGLLRFMNDQSGDILSSSPFRKFRLSQSDGNSFFGKLEALTGNSLRLISNHSTSRFIWVHPVVSAFHCHPEPKKSRQRHPLRFWITPAQIKTQSEISKHNYSGQTVSHLVFFLFHYIRTYIHTKHTL